MATQPRLVQQPGRRRMPTVSGPPLTARARLVRLLAVAAATVVVVAVWSLRDDNPQIGPPAEARITAPAPEARLGEILPSAGDRLPPPSALVPDALPRPPEPAEPIQPASFERFIVQRGDTLYDISVVFGVSIDDLLRFNRTLGDGASLSVGQTVLVPVFVE